MARKKMSEFMYEKLVTAFREKPGNAAYAARECRLDRRTAMRAWKEGWRKPWAPPIERFLRDEQEKVRAQRQAAIDDKARIAEESRNKARQDAITAQAQEAALSSVARANSIGLGNMIMRIVQAALLPAQQLADSMKSGEVKFTPKETIKLMKDIAIVVRLANEAARESFNIERLRVGDPTDIFKLEVSEMAPEELVSQLSRINRTLERAKNRPSNELNDDLMQGGLDAAYPFEDELEQAGIKPNMRRPGGSQ